MLKKLILAGCVLSFVMGFFVIYFRHTPLNPDVRATVKALRIGMEKEEAMQILRMSFLLNESRAADGQEYGKGGGQVCSIVDGVMPGRAYRYFIKAGFSKDGRLVSLDYSSKKGWMWIFHHNRVPHLWQHDQ